MGSTDIEAAWTRSTVVGADGVALAAFEQGPPDAPTVLLVHGFPDDHHVWDLVAADLAADHHVVAHDVRGIGASEAPWVTDGFRMMALIDDIDAVAEATAPGRQVHLVGHDWGSIQSWAAALHPGARARFASYTSISAPALQHVGPWRAARWRQGPKGWRAIAHQAVRSSYIPAFHTGLAPKVWRDVVSPRWREQMEKEGAVVDDEWPSPQIAQDGVRGLELYRANLGVLKRRTLPAAEWPTSVPVLLLVAALDPHVTIRLLDGIDAMTTDFTRVDLPAGHWVPRSHPTEVAAAIRAHVAAHPTSS